MSLKSQYDELAALERGWDSYGAKPIDPRAIAAAKDFEARVQRVPTVSGGVQLEWYCQGVDLEITFAPSGRVVRVRAEEDAWSVDTNVVELTVSGTQEE